MPETREDVPSEAKAAVSMGLRLSARNIAASWRKAGGGWIDIYESDGKHSGAIPGLRRSSLRALNYKGTLRDVHIGSEMGHAVHFISRMKISHMSTPVTLYLRLRSPLR